MDLAFADQLARDRSAHGLKRLGQTAGKFEQNSLKNFRQRQPKKAGNWNNCAKMLAMRMPMDP